MSKVSLTKTLRPTAAENAEYYKEMMIRLDNFFPSRAKELPVCTCDLCTGNVPAFTSHLDEM
jgi:hypothetical protein